MRTDRTSKLPPFFTQVIGSLPSDIGVAALLQDMENIQVTARVIHRAVGDLQKGGPVEETTFHGGDLVQSLGSVLCSALPLLKSTNDMDMIIGDEEEPIENAMIMHVPVSSRALTTRRMLSSFFCWPWLLSAS